jgi:hypothetical protein
VTAVPNWEIGETFLFSEGEQLRIRAIDTDVDEELVDRGITAVFTVEPA